MHQWKYLKSDVKQIFRDNSENSAMGNLLSMFRYRNTLVVFYKCPPQQDLDDKFPNQFLYAEDPFVFLSSPGAEIITIEESDY